MNEQQPVGPERRPELAVAWDLFRYWTGTADRPAFQAAYLGRYDSRADFGQALLAEYDAPRRLAQLPNWLQHYLTVDTEAFVRDFEQAGHFYLAEAPDGAGTFVFDPHVIGENRVAALQQKADNRG